jgi:drug/metabolite transporter (DMT)-like permease
MFKSDQKWLFLILLSLIWGSSFILIKKSLIGLSPVQLGALRIVISGLLIFVVGFKGLSQQSRRTLKWIFISGFLGTFFPAFLFAFAITEIDSAVASILNSLVPLNTIIIGFILFQIYSSRKQVIGVIIGLMGTVMLISNGAHINPDQNYWFAFLIILATLMYAMNVNIIKRHLQDIAPITIAVGNFVVIILPAFLVLILSGFFTSEVLEGADLKMSLLYVFLLSLFGTALAKIMFNKLIQISTPVFASSVTYLMPVIAVMWGLLDGEVFSLWQTIATGFILWGVYLAHSNT